MFGLLETLFYVFIGLMLGWNLPQPAWAKSLWAKAKTKIKSWF